MATPEDSRINMNWTPEFGSYTPSAEQPAWAVCTLKAPFYEPTSRAPVDIVAVIDKSGSMHGEKLDLVKETLEFVIDQCKYQVYMYVRAPPTFIEYCTAPLIMVSFLFANADSMACIFLIILHFYEGKNESRVRPRHLLWTQQNGIPEVCSFIIIINLRPWVEERRYKRFPNFSFHISR